MNELLVPLGLAKVGFKSSCEFNIKNYYCLLSPSFGTGVGALVYRNSNFMVISRDHLVGQELGLLIPIYMLGEVREVVLW